MRFSIVDLRDGKNEAFKYLFDTQYHRLIDISKRFLHDRSTFVQSIAEDAVCVAFHRLYLFRKTVNSLDHAVSLLVIMVKRACMAFIKKDVNATKHKIYTSNLTEEEYNQHEWAEAKNYVEYLTQFIDCLPDWCREIFKMIFICDMSYEEILEANPKLDPALLRSAKTIGLNNLRDFIMLSEDIEKCRQVMDLLIVGKSLAGISEAVGIDVSCLGMLSRRFAFKKVSYNSAEGKRRFALFIEHLPESQKRVTTLFLEGKRPSEIGIIMGLKEVTVHDTKQKVANKSENILIFNNNNPLRFVDYKQKVTDAQIENIKRLVKDGLSISEIANILKEAYAFVYYIYKKYIKPDGLAVKHVKAPAQVKPLLYRKR